MEGVRRLARSGSLMVEELFSSKNKQNGEEIVEDTDTPTILPILRSFHTGGKVNTKTEKEYEEMFNGKIVYYS